MAALNDPVVWTILDGCRRSPEGFLLDASHPVVAGLVKEGLLELGDGGRATVTPKGEEVLARFAEGIDG